MVHEGRDSRQLQSFDLNNSKDGLATVEAGEPWIGHSFEETIEIRSVVVDILICNGH